MAKIRRDIKRASVTNKTSAAAVIAAACAGNPNASALTAKLSAFATLTATLTTSYNDSQTKQAASQSATVVLNTDDAAWDAGFDELADAALIALAGDAAKIESLGLSVYDPGAHPPVGAMTQVLNFVATIGDFTGTVDVGWDKVAGARSYEVQVTTTPDVEGSWHHALTAVRSSGTVTGLVSGTKYWFRVAAIGSAGQGPWSDPATKMAG